jgi:hypothetical protein
MSSDSDGKREKKKEKKEERTLFLVVAGEFSLF